MSSSDPSPSFTSAAQLPRRAVSPPADPPSPPPRQPPPVRPLPGQQAAGAAGAAASGSGSSRAGGQSGSLRNAAGVGGEPVRASATPGPSTSAAAAAAGGGTVGAPPVAKPVVQQASRTKNAIVVSARQRGNPIIPFIKGVPWEYGEIVPDYVVGAHSCVLYLSLRYHRLHPEYLHGRIEKLGAMYELRVILVHCDVSDPQEPIREITKICLINNLTVVVAWTPEEAGQYIATYKLYEHKSPDILKERVAQGYESQLHRLLTAVKGVNKTDVLTLSTSFGSFERMVNATNEELSLCPGLGDVKVRRLREAFTTPFRGGPPPSTTNNSTQRALDEMGIDRITSSSSSMLAANIVGVSQAAPGRVSSPDWPSDDDERLPPAADAGRKQAPTPAAAVAREPSPDWPSDDGDEPMIDVDDLIQPTS